MFTPFLIVAILVSSGLTSAASLDSSGDSRHEHPKCDFIIKKWTLWDGGMAATLKIPVVKDVESWNVVVSFNKQFQKLSFFNALQNSTEGSSFSLDNEAWSGTKKQGDVIAFSLLGDYSDGAAGEPLEIETVSLNDDVMCRNREQE